MRDARSKEQPEVDERLSALLSNVGAVRAAAAAIEGTIGPKGLDTMLVDRYGETVVTNDGITILTQMDATHPAARLVVSGARAQEETVGDGTTTTTILASSLLDEAVDHVVKGVPVSRVIEGVKLGISHALDAVKEQARPLRGLDDPMLWQTAMIAGRGHNDIAALVIEAARLWGWDRCSDPTFALADSIFAELRAESAVFEGVLIQRERVDRDAPEQLSPVVALVLDDALEPETVEPEALATETGFARQLAQRDEFRGSVQKLVDLGVNLVILDRGIDDAALQMLTDAGVVVLHRVAMSEWRRAAEFTGARVLKRTALRKRPEELASYCGRAERAVANEQLGHFRIMGGMGRPAATIIVGAATAEVVEERQRIAKDAAASVQAAIAAGVVPGGGAIELHAALMVDQLRQTVGGMAAYGVACVAEALRKPLALIVLNAGYNPLEQVGAAAAAQSASGANSIAVDCETGQLADMWTLGVVDPTLVKLHAIRTAGEIAEAILRINTIVKMREPDRPS